MNASLPLVQTASGLLLDSQDRMLLGLRASWKRVWPNLWDAIGGHLEPGESVEMALARELDEELGVTPTAYQLIGSFPGSRADLYGEALHHVFAVTAWTGGQPSNVCDEHSEIRWFTLEEVLALTNTTGFDFAHLFALAKAARREVCAARYQRGAASAVSMAWATSSTEPMPSTSTSFLWVW